MKPAEHTLGDLAFASAGARAPRPPHGPTRGRAPPDRRRGLVETLSISCHSHRVGVRWRVRRGTEYRPTVALGMVSGHDAVIRDFDAEIRGPLVALASQGVDTRRQLAFRRPRGYRSPSHSRRRSSAYITAAQSSRQVWPLGVSQSHRAIWSLTIPISPSGSRSPRCASRAARRLSISRRVIWSHPHPRLRSRARSTDESARADRSGRSRP